MLSKLTIDVYSFWTRNFSFSLGLMTELDLDLTHAVEIPPGTECCNNKRKLTLPQMQLSRLENVPRRLTYRPG